MEDTVKSRCFCFSSTRLFKKQEKDTENSNLYPFRNVNLDIKSKEENFIHKYHFVLIYIKTVLILTGISEIQIKHKTPNYYLTKFMYYAWNIILLMQIICLISNVLSFCMYSDVKYFISVSLFHSFIIILRGVQIKSKKQFTNLLLQLDRLEHLRNVPSLKFQLLAFSGCVLIIVTVRNIICHMTANSEFLNRVSDTNIFHLHWKVHPNILPSFLLSIWISTEGIFPPVFVIIYILVCYVLKKEFQLISVDVTKCENANNGKSVYLFYVKALEIGKLIDNALSPPLFYAIVYMMVTLFYRGYSIFLEGDTDAYEVRLYLKYYLYFLCYLCENCMEWINFN